MDPNKQGFSICSEGHAAVCYAPDIECPACGEKIKQAELRCTIDYLEDKIRQMNAKI